LDLLDTISSIKEADINNVFMYGHSMGGMVTLAVLESTNMIKAATLWSAVSEQFPESSLFFIRKRNIVQADEMLQFYKDTFGEENFGKFSPTNYLNYIQAPLIIQHGTKDDSVPFKWSVDLAEKLKENNKYYEFYSYEGDDHNFAKGSFYKVLKKDVDFFKKYMTN
ncbi:MAG: prolyl oligopeptidase family serine peptidase, partial [Spirochaetes bacterium]|nr:prolyl oligopeptidase family serine peptidase [Spirochaetota bacterium]